LEPAPFSERLFAKSSPGVLSVVVFLPAVMAGLEPAIHAEPMSRTSQVVPGLGAWMPGTSPGMTGESVPKGWKRRTDCANSP